MGKKNNVIKYRRPLSINIGVVVFLIIFIYLIFYVYTYLTETHVSVYEVEQGTIASNNIYSGLALRTEKIYQADDTGALNYYVRENSKVCYQELICSIDENGSISERIYEASQDASGISKKISSEITEKIENFQTIYADQNFYNVYSFKEDINSLLNEALSLEALEQISEYVATAEENHTFHKLYAPEAGIISYYTDGFENVTVDNFNSSMFDETSYQKVNLKARTEIQAGEPAYKIIESEYWNIIIPVSAELAADLSDGSVIRIRFVKDSKEIYANYTIEQRNGLNYLVLSLKSAMVRYASERYIEVELMLNEENGLKIPNSSITEKEFYTIPLDYFLKGGDSSNDGLLVEHVNEDGMRTTEFINPVIYYETDEYGYVDSEDIMAGDTLIRQDSNDTYTVGRETATLKGVYNINKGYAVFKQIDILYQNEEYSIIKTGTSYGLTLYDHIALDASKVQENELIK